MNYICIPTEIPELTSNVDAHFGLPKSFVIIDEAGDIVHRIPGDNNSQKGQIIKYAKTLGFDKIVTYHMGGGVFDMCEQVGIKIYMLDSITTVTDAIEQYKSGKTTLLQGTKDLSCGDVCHH
jgi:predicted Fe-Mo cluster-binding NifX family protein